MFGFSLAAQLFQGSAQRTWNCVTQFSNLLWHKFNHFKYPVMPRSRRRHHSRSRSRSRSHSHDRDREPKRRKIDNVDSPAHKRSVSEEPISPPPKLEEPESVGTSKSQETDKKTMKDKLEITPKKTLSPKQVQKKLESEKKREQKRLEREERERKKQEEKDKKQEEKDKMKALKTKEREMKEEQIKKKREEKEAKRKEKEEREEAKRKERELEKLKKQQELEEKSREKQKIEEQKQKAAQAFVNFFVAKEGKTEVRFEEKGLFMPFEVKSDMRLAPPRRPEMTEDEKTNLTESLGTTQATYLTEIKGRHPRRCGKTWPYDADDDVVIVEEDFGESICEDKQKLTKMRVKFLKFHENKRPAYYGTWRKTSRNVTPRRPFAQDKVFDYDVDSDDDWEEEEQGESLNGSDDEDKENEVENDDYEVDNEFFVPHGHLSDDEVDDEELSKLSPESHKLKLKLLKDEFDEDMQAKINKMKARSIGCIWYNKDGGNVDEAIDRHLRPLAMITNGQVIINRRKDFVAITSMRKTKELQQELVPTFLKIINGNVNKKAVVVEEFMNYLKSKGHVVEVSKAYLKRCLKQYAQWKKCPEEGPLFNKFCWCLEDDVKKKYSLE